MDADIGWHLLLTTAGTESQREIRINPQVDLPDEIHPIYGDDDMALTRATAAIDEAAHYRDDVTVTCPLGLGAGIGDVVNVPVDGVAVIGQVESIAWTATPDGQAEQAVIRRYVAIAPAAYVEPTPVVPPTVADDTGAVLIGSTTSGNVLSNDTPGLVVSAVNGLVANVGVPIIGSTGGTFTVAEDGDWTFDPGDDFGLLPSGASTTTAVSYYASDGLAEAMATLTVTVTQTQTIELVYETTVFRPTTSDFVIDLPEEIEPDDFVIYFCAVAKNASIGATGFASTGFSATFLKYSGAETWAVSTVGRSRFMPNPPPASIIITNPAFPAVVVLQVYRGVNSTTPYDTYASTAGINSPIPDSPQITTVTDQTMVISIGALGHSTEQAPIAPSGYSLDSLVWGVPGSYGIQLMFASKVKSVAGVENPDAWGGIAGNTAGAFNAYTIALRPKS